MGKIWKSLSIAKKIWCGLGIMICGYLITLGCGFLSGKQTEKYLESVEKTLLPAYNYGEAIKTAYEKQLQSYQDAVMYGEESLLASAQNSASGIQELLIEIEDLKDLDPDLKDEVSTIRKDMKQFSGEAKLVYSKMIVNGENADPQNTLRAQKLHEEKTRLKERQNVLTRKFKEGLQYEISSIIHFTKFFGVLNVFIFIGVVSVTFLSVSVIFTRSLNNPIKECVSMIQDIAEGDLTQHFYIDSNDEIGELVHALNKMVEGLKEMVRTVTDTIMKSNLCASEISSAVEEQAAITSEQAASVSEITATMEALSQSATQVAGHSNKVSEIADNALQNTKEGADAVKMITAKMNEINEDNKNNIKQLVDLGKKSEEITKVMEIINNIADQTKLIAFNAALEASSAGEAGKRFGVVAVEIRRLADSVMESTGETAKKINEIQAAFNQMVIASEKGSKGIQEGLEYSTRTGGKLANIVGGVQSTADAAKQISLSTQQTKTASDQVVVALREINQGARQTTDSIKQISAISKELADLSGNLKNMAKKFKLSSETDSTKDFESDFAFSTSEEKTDTTAKDSPRGRSEAGPQ